jgi:2-polyprenyl-6-methoxyphenol hydroxylase-like FAD-dependent oxidoreductase
MINKKILIVGAGPVGLAAAVELTRRGAKPRVIDQNSGPNPNSRALAVNTRTLDLMEPSGVSQDLLAAGHQLHRAVMRQGLKVKARFNFKTIPHKYNFLLVLAQHETEVILEKHLASMGIMVERNLGLASLETGDRPKATFSNGKSATFDIVIGTDGAHSVVRTALGITYPGESEPDQFGLADVTIENWPFPDDTAVVTFLDPHVAPYIPMAKDAAGKSTGRFITTVPGCLHHLPPDAKIKSVIWDTDFRISYRQADTYQNGNCFVAGDAAHIHSPVGGRGMNLGIEDACWLAWLINDGREKEFTALRHPVAKHVLGFTQGFTRLARAQGWGRRLAVNVGLPLLSHLPFVQRKIFYMLSAQDTPAPPWIQAK